MDFLKLKERIVGKKIEIYPDLQVVRSRDLMVRGKAFYAIWDEERKLWSTDEYDVQRLVDKELREYVERRGLPPSEVVVRYMSDFSTTSWQNYRRWIAAIADSSHQLDSTVCFRDQETTRRDFVSHKLPYNLDPGGDMSAYEELMSTLYSPEERAKLEWAIGSIFAGDSRDIQKFVVLYGAAGSGKSTFLKILESLFEGYYTAFEAKALTTAGNQFSTEVFRTNPLVAIQHDGDLSRIEDNTRLNSIVSHEMMVRNEKYKASYMERANCFLFMGTNKPVKITDAKSGIIRRLIDVRPTGNKVAVGRYHILIARIPFELGAIANHCLERYKMMGKNYYSGYRPVGMMFETDFFFNFVDANKDRFEEPVKLQTAYELYKIYCEESSVEARLPKYRFRDELSNYFEDFFDVVKIDGKQVRSVFSGLKKEKFQKSEEKKQEAPSWLSLDSEESLFDVLGKDYPAQYASTKYEVPPKHWVDSSSTLQNINTRRLHYVKLPPHHIVVDFDIKGEDGEKSAELNIEAAGRFPPTYAEYSKSGKGLHLHYIYLGDPEKLAPSFSKGIEVKTFPGDASLRRKLTKCNNIGIANISSGLPIKEEKKVINVDGIKSEKGLRALIKRNLQKEIHPATKPSIDFIEKILIEAYDSGMKYDVSDMRPAILAFAASSTHQAKRCIEIVAGMKFSSVDTSDPDNYSQEAPIAFFDVEVFPNLVLVVWKYQGPERNCVPLVNPKPDMIEDLIKMRLIGFNNRRYDNHILYALLLGYRPDEIYNLSKRLIEESRNALFGEAYNISYADIYDFSSVKQSLKKWEIELGIHHQELGLPFDEPVKEEDLVRVIDYCSNDVIASEAVFENRKQDFVARQILADLSGLTVTDTTQMHTAKIIFGNERKPSDQFVYTDLSEMFPGYQYRDGKSTYRGEVVGEGGYVYAEPNFYQNTVLLDVASMHPTSIKELNLFGPFTENFVQLLAARLAIKHKKLDELKTLLGGRLSNYIVGGEGLDDLAYALKIVINIVYGLTSATFDSKFRDPRNVDNIVAKRGALFMIDLKHAVQERGYTVAHIKTDSIKIPNADKDIIAFVKEFGSRYGYTFEYEGTFDKFLLVNDAVYIGHYADGKNGGKWSAVGTQFQKPYIFKTLFNHEPIGFEDLAETKSVTTALYLDLNEGLDPDEHNYVFVGKVGSFVPVKPGKGGGILLRQSSDGSYHSATGAKGYRWLEAEIVKSIADVDMSYHDKLLNEAIDDISKFVDPKMFMPERKD